MALRGRDSRCRRQRPCCALVVAADVSRAGDRLSFLQRPLSDRGGCRVVTGVPFADVGAAGHIRIEITQTYALSDAVQAHTDLEARKTTGSTVLLP